MFQFQLRRLSVVSKAQVMSCWLYTLSLQVLRCNRWHSQALLEEISLTQHAMQVALLKQHGGLRRLSSGEWFVRVP